MAKRDLEADTARLDKAIDAVLEVMLLEPPKETARMPGDESDIERHRLSFLAKSRFEGAKALVPLLERRAKLLGLDAKPDEHPHGEESAVERMTRQLREQGTS